MALPVLAMRSPIVPAGTTKQLAVGLVGCGQVGQTLVHQIAARHDYFKERLGMDVKLVGVANSRNMLLEKAGMSLKDWPKDLEARGTPADLDAFSRHVEGLDVDGVVIDCTASDGPCEYYARWMSAGCHVITPNKKLHSGPLARYRAVRQLQEEGKAHYFYEASCGAGLPVLNTLKGLIEGGDRVIAIEGILSGTLSYVFNSWKVGQPFSEVVLTAKQLGYTEPDPREDLSGMDVARKVTILARECGSGAILEDLEVASLVPEALRAVPVDEFLRRLPEFDADMAAQLADAQAEGCVLRYVGKYDAESDQCSITLARYPASHPFAALNGTDNIVSIRTERYDAQPLIIRGPGAGLEVTAGGVLADLLQLMRYMGARG